MRIILYTGKGGVGKTSAAAISACHMAESGKKVLIVSTDQAHSLSDSFDRKLGKEPIEVSENLKALEIDTVYESEKSWGNLKEYLKQLLTLKGGSGIEVEELLVFPGLEELFSMFKILDMSESGEYDVIVVDCAPTGETLSLLKYPEKFSDFIEKVLPIKRKGVKMVGSTVEKITKIPMPKDSVFDDMEYLMDKMERLQKLLLNKDIVSLRIVTTPEKIVIKESKRNYTCLLLYNYNVDTIIVNKIYPEKAMEGYFNKWMKLQKEGLREIKESFSEIPKFYLELQEKEVRTLPILKEMASRLFTNIDLTDVMFVEEAFKVITEEDRPIMKVYLPFAEKEKLDLYQEENEIIISVKNERRRIPLPVNLLDSDITSAKFREGYLLIAF